MWICLNDAFLSIVEDRDDKNTLRVRARVAGDIERVFPKAKVEERPLNDYRYMALVDRMMVAEAVMRRVIAIDYGNFKASVQERDRHDYYLSVWGVLHRFGLARLRRRAS